jgi:hypothetical protein
MGKVIAYFIKRLADSLDRMKYARVRINLYNTIAAFNGAHRLRSFPLPYIYIISHLEKKINSPIKQTYEKIFVKDVQKIW